MLRTLGTTTWNKIKIGEIFALEGCWYIAEKVDEGHMRCLTDDTNAFDGNMGEIVDSVVIKDGLSAGELIPILKYMNIVINIHKLPKSIQKLWKEDENESHRKIYTNYRKIS